METNAKLLKEPTLIIAYYDKLPCWVGTGKYRNTLEKIGDESYAIQVITYHRLDDTNGPEFRAGHANGHQLLTLEELQSGYGIWIVKKNFPFKIIKTNPTKEDINKTIFMIKTGILT